MYPLFPLLVILSSCAGLTGQKYTVLTYNIRVDFGGDGEDNWDHRKEAMADFISETHPAIFGTQEGLPHQIDYLDSSLGSYSYFGIGRDSGAGEHTAIFYDVDRFDLLDQGTFWLSSTGDTASVGWDAALTRICTYGRLRDIGTGNEFVVFNAHFDHIGQKARVQSARQIADSVSLMLATGLPVVVMGDFNSEPGGKPVKTLTSVIPCAADLSSKGIEGGAGTFNGFDMEIVPSRRIDYIFTSGFDVIRYAHLDPRTKQGRRVSDHQPVMAELQLD